MRSRISILAFCLLSFFAALLSARIAGAAVPRSFEQEPVPAAPSTHPKRPATIEAVRFGFDGYLSSDAWSPIRVYLSGNPTINSGAFAGTVTIDFTQDATQSANVSVNISTTPGRVIPFEIIAAIPRATPSIRVQLRDLAGNVVDERQYWQYQFGQTPLPASILDGVHLVVAIADRSGAQPSIARALKQPEDVPENQEPVDPDNSDQTRFDDRLACCVVREDDLPMSEFGFGGVAAVAARSEVLASLAPQKLNALVSWVQSGGCLIVLAGADPQSWIGHFWDSSPFSAHDFASFDPGAELAPLAARPDPGSAPTGRIMRLVRPIAETGWRIDWTTTTVNRQDGEAMDGLLAQGPAGFGWIVVLGIDPASLGKTSAQRTRMWTEALRLAFAEIAGRPIPDQNDYWRARGSGPDGASRIAVKSSLDSMTDVPSLGDGAFIAIALSLILLAVAVGPFDALVLRRAKLRAWSWATALGWIAVASALAAIVPPLIRTGDSTLNRFRVVDVVQSADAPVSARQVALSSVFANAFSSVTFSDPGSAREEPIGWFRGVSASYLDDYGHSQPLATFATFQSDVRAEGGWSSRNNAPSGKWPLSMGQWTLRSFMSARAGVQLAPPTVRLSRTGRTWVVNVTGLSGKKAEGSLRIGDDRFELASAAIVNAATTVEFESGKRLGAIQRRDSQALRRGEFDGSASEPPLSTATLLELPGPRERSRAVEALLASGGWSCVYLRETGNNPTLKARAAGDATDFVSTESTLWRILVPLDPDDRFSPLPLPSAPAALTAPSGKKGTP